MEKIIINTSKYCHIIPKDDIIYCMKDNGWLNIVLINEQIVRVRKSLSEVSKLLMGFNFISPHRSHLINLKHFKSIHQYPEIFVNMSGGYQIPVSRRRMKQVIQSIHSEHTLGG